MYLNCPIKAISRDKRTPPPTKFLNLKSCLIGSPLISRDNLNLAGLRICRKYFNLKSTGFGMDTIPSPWQLRDYYDLVPLSLILAHFKTSPSIVYSLKNYEVTLIPCPIKPSDRKQSYNLYIHTYRLASRRSGGPSWPQSWSVTSTRLTSWRRWGRTWSEPWLRPRDPCVSTRRTSTTGKSYNN